jgi:hypothetical protein
MVARTHMMYLPKMGGGAVFRAGKMRTSMKGRGVGSVLLDGGLGGQSSYESVDDYVSTTGRTIGGSGVASSLAKVGGKISNLVIKQENKKPPRKNINFSL